MEKAKTLMVVILWREKKGIRAAGILTWIASKTEAEKYALKY